MTAQCFYPDGTLSVGNAAGSPQLVPCDPSASASSCCAAGDTCFSNGLCMSSEFFHYRGGCTDKSWPAASCATQCISGKQAVSSSSILNFFQVISLCQNVFDNVTPGGKLFTCSPLTSDCANGNFTLTPSNVTFTKITGNAAHTLSSNSSSAVPIATVTSTTIASDCPQQTTGVRPGIVGVAVAVPVVVISILALFFFFWERRKRVNAEKNLLHTAAMATKSTNSNSNSTDSNNTNHHRQDLKQYVPIVEAGDGDINRITELPASDGVATRKPENSQWT